MQVFAKLPIFIGFCLMGFSSVYADDKIKLRLPANCQLGTTCFLQQMPDVDLSPAARDPFGGNATYDGHKGTDIRLRYFDDIDENMSVVAGADGTVLRLRDGVADKLVRTAQDRARIRELECGNGVIISHGGGWETQYCHLKRGSISVSQGQKIKAGERLGAIGSSGLAEFAHIHMTVTKDGKIVDPFSASIIGAGDAERLDAATDMWIDDAVFEAGKMTTQILDTGIAGGPVDHDALAVARPDDADRNSAAFVGWVSLINLQMGDVVKLALVTPDGKTTIRNDTEPLDRPKATYSLFAGRRGAPMPGDYKLAVGVLRNGSLAVEHRQTIRVD